MLAQGQSSPAKRGGLVVDVSSGLIFLKKKKNFSNNVYTLCEQKRVRKTLPKKNVNSLRAVSGSSVHIVV